MNISALLAEAGLLMLVGMVVVFLFLSLLILAINLLAKFAEAFPDKVVTPAARPISSSTNSNQVSPQVVAAVGAAIKQYKSRNK
ncbi:MAG: OadG family protein [Gammaproteobacteria bacterium]|nr:OadG family protein [Gammaproteobacteria bacterium]